MKTIVANIVGLLKFILLIFTTFFLPAPRRERPAPIRSDFKTEEDYQKEFEKYRNLVGESEELLGGIETKFCPKCHVPVTQFRRTEKGLQIIKGNKVTVTIGNNVTVRAGGKEERGFPMRCPNGHSVRIE